MSRKTSRSRVEVVQKWDKGSWYRLQLNTRRSTGSNCRTNWYKLTSKTSTRCWTWTTWSLSYTTCICATTRRWLRIARFRRQSCTSGTMWWWFTRWPGYWKSATNKRTTLCSRAIRTLNCSCQRLGKQWTWTATSRSEKEWAFMLERH